MDDETERALLKDYALHVVLMVKAAIAAIESGRVRVEDGRLVCLDRPKSTRTPGTDVEAHPDSPDTLWFR